MGLRPHYSCQESSQSLRCLRLGDKFKASRLSLKDKQEVPRCQQRRKVQDEEKNVAIYLSPNTLIFNFFLSKTTTTDLKMLMIPFCPLPTDGGLCPDKQKGLWPLKLPMLSWGAASPKPRSFRCQSSQTAPCATYIYTQLMHWVISSWVTPLNSPGFLPQYYINSNLTTSHPALYFHQLPPQAVTEYGSTTGNEH